MRLIGVFSLLFAVLILASACGASVVAKAGKASVKASAKASGKATYRQLSAAELEQLRAYVRQAELQRYQARRREEARQFFEQRRETREQQVSNEELSEEVAELLDRMSSVADLQDQPYQDEDDRPQL